MFVLLFNAVYLTSLIIYGALFSYCKYCTHLSNLTTTCGLVTTPSIDLLLYAVVYSLKLTVNLCLICITPLYSYYKL